MKTSLEQDFQKRCDEWREKVRSEVHVVGVKGKTPKLDGHEFIEIRPHTWPVYGKPDGVSKTAVVYVFKRIE